MDRRQQLALTFFALALCGALGAARAQEATPAASPAPSAPVRQQPSVASPAPSPLPPPRAAEPPPRLRPFRVEGRQPGPDNNEAPRPADLKAERKAERMEARREAEQPLMDRPVLKDRLLDRMQERRNLEAANGPKMQDEPKGPKDRLLDRMQERRNLEAGGPKPHDEPKAPRDPKRGGPPPDAALQQMLDQLPPGKARELLQENIARWRELPPEERQALRNQQGQRTERIQEEVDNVLRDSGLKLDDDQRQVFRLRYTQERRKLERQLREQMESDRAKRLPQIVEQLKQEFSRPAPPPPAGKGAPPPPVGQSATPPPPASTAVPTPAAP